MAAVGRLILSHADENLIQPCVIKFVSYILQDFGFSWYSSLIFSTNKTDHHLIKEILLKVSLNTPMAITLDSVNLIS